MTREELILAFVDGELPAEAAARLEADMAADPALAREVARHRALARRVAGAYAPVLDEAIPPQLMAAAAAANDRAPLRRALPPWAAAAAALVVGVVAGRAAWPEQGPVVERHGVLTARAGLDRALSTELASDTGPVKVGLTLKASDGRYCRTFESRADALAGLACRSDGAWQVRTLTAWRAPAATPYRQAGSETPPEVLAAVDALGGQPLDAAGERAARDAGWR